MKARDVNRATENDFSPFEDWQILELYNSMSPRKLTGFMDRRAMERRTQDLLDVRGLMVYGSNNGGAQYQVAGIWIYRAESHPVNVEALGYVHKDSNRIIRMLVDKNPKWGKAAERFALYRDGMTVYEYRLACRERQGGDAWKTAESDIDYDTKKGFIRIEINSDQQLADHARETILNR